MKMRLLGICICLIAMLMGLFCIPVFGEGEAMSFTFELSVDGKDVKEVKTGDIITVVLRLKRTDADLPYTMYAMQDEIRYDSTFLELVEDSCMLGPGIVATDVAMVDQYREFYMNFLSMTDGVTWKSDVIIGSFQLRVIGDSGVTKITSQDYIVSTKDGRGTYSCEANEVTLVISTECTVSFRTNGGTEITEQKIPFGEKITKPEDPVREGYRLEGWYQDIHLTQPWNFEQDTVQGNMFLYAKWVKADSSDISQDDLLKEIIGAWWLWLLVLLLIILLIMSTKRIKQNLNSSKVKKNLRQGEQQ